MSRALVDVRIVGGGIAGIVTGVQLLLSDPDAHHDVTVYERGPAVSTTLCGEGLSSVTLGRLDWPGFDHRPFVGADFQGAAWYISNGKCITLPDACHTMDRARWIPKMAEYLESLGGRIRLGHKLTMGDIRNLPGDLVVGADGPGSQVRKVIGGHVDTRLGIQYRMADTGYETDRLIFVTDKRFSPEYSWVFPRGDMDNVGLLAHEDGHDWDRLDRFMAHWGVGGRRLKKEAYPIAFNGRKLQEGRYVLIGDAAGLTNPVTKGGMAAIVYAAEILADCVRDGRLDDYERRVRAHPISDASFQRAVDIIVRTSNEDVEHWARFLPQELALGQRKRGVTWGLVTRSAFGNIARLPDFYQLYRALALSRVYSW